MTVTVLDVNDNPPVWNLPEYHFGKYDAPGWTRTRTAWVPPLYQSFRSTKLWHWNLTHASMVVTPRAHARSGVKQWVLSVSQSVSVSVCHQNFGLITTTKGLNASKRHSNSDNSEKTVHGVPEGG